MRFDNDKKMGRGRRVLNMVAVPLLLASLAACAAPFNAKVSRFQSQLPAPQGQSTPIIVAVTGEDSAG